MIENIVLLVVGLVGLWFSAEKTVDNAEKLIKAFGLPSFLFGAVFMSVSTGLPEIATAIISTIEGVPGLSAGDITGSSLVNLTFVLGITVLVNKGINLRGEDLDLIRMGGIATLVAALFLLIFQELTLPIVAILFGIYAFFLYRAEHSSFKIDEGGKASKLTILKTLIGVAALLISARSMVLGAKGIGEALGIPVQILGATVVAVGTGLPELAFEISAVKKGDTSLALGDIFGSTLVNITLTLGILGIISNISLSSLAPVLLGLVMATTLALIFSYRGDFSLLEASILLTVFLIYIVLQAI